MNTSQENIFYQQNINPEMPQLSFKKTLQDNNDSNFKHQPKIKSNQKIWNQSMAESQQKCKDLVGFEINDGEIINDDDQQWPQIDLNYSQNISQQNQSFLENAQKQTKQNSELNTNATFLSKNTLTLGNFQSPTYINLNYLQQFIKNTKNQKALDLLMQQQQSEIKLNLIDNNEQKLQEPSINTNNLLLQYDTLDQLKELDLNSSQVQGNSIDKGSLGTTLFEFKNYLNINMMLKDYESLKSECQKYQYEIFQKNDKIIHLETYYQQVISQQQQEVLQLQQTINSQQQLIQNTQQELALYEQKLSELKQQNTNLHSIIEQYSLMINNQENQQILINNQPALDQITLASSINGSYHPNSAQSNSFSFYSGQSKHSKRVQSVQQLKQIALMQKSNDSLPTYKLSNLLPHENIAKIMEILETNNNYQIVEKLQELVKRLQTYNKFQDSLTIIIKQCHPEIPINKPISLKEAWKFIKTIFAEYIDLKKSQTIITKSNFTKKQNRTEREVLKDSSNLTLNQCTNANQPAKNNAQNYYFCSKTLYPSNSHQRFSVRKSNSIYQNENLSLRPTSTQKNLSYSKL